MKHMTIEHTQKVRPHPAQSNFPSEHSNQRQGHLLFSVEKCILIEVAMQLSLEIDINTKFYHLHLGISIIVKHATQLSVQEDDY